MCITRSSCISELLPILIAIKQPVKCFKQVISLYIHKYATKILNMPEWKKKAIRVHVPDILFNLLVHLVMMLFCLTCYFTFLSILCKIVVCNFSVYNWCLFYCFLFLFVFCNMFIQCTIKFEGKFQLPNISLFSW